MRKAILAALAVLFLWTTAGAQSQSPGVVPISVTNTPTNITLNAACSQISCLSVVVKENSATPTAVFSVTPRGTTTAINVAAGGSFEFDAPSVSPFIAGQVLGTITATTSGPFSFVAIESAARATGTNGSGTGGGGSGGSPGGSATSVQFNTGSGFGGDTFFTYSTQNFGLNDGSGNFSQLTPFNFNIQNTAGSSSFGGAGDLGVYDATTMKEYDFLVNSGSGLLEIGTPNFTSDEMGNLVAPGCTGCATIQQTGTTQTQRPLLNFIPPMVVSDNASNTSTDVTCANCLNVSSNSQSANQLISGGMVEWTGLYNFTVGAATYSIAGSLYTSPLTDITLSPADPSLDRIDVIALDNTGSVVVLTGTPAATPAQPEVDPTTQLELTFVYVAAASTAPAQITKVDLYHSNTEWTTARNPNTNPPWNLASTNNPYDTTVTIEATNAAINNFITLTDPAAGTVDLAQSNALVFYIRSKAAWTAARSLTIRWYNGATAKGQAIVLRDGTFGFTSTNTTTYQQVSIPTNLFGINGVPVTTLRFTVSGTGTSHIGFYLDDITLQAGAATLTLPTGLMIYRGAWASTTAYNANDVVTDSGSTYVALVPNTNSAPPSSAWQLLGAGGLSAPFSQFTSGPLALLGTTANDNSGFELKNVAGTDVISITESGGVGDFQLDAASGNLFDVSSSAGTFSYTNFGSGLGCIWSIGYMDCAVMGSPGNPPSGYDRMYFDGTSGNLTCLTSTGASCVNVLGLGLFFYSTTGSGPYPLLSYNIGSDLLYMGTTQGELPGFEVDGTTGENRITQSTNEIVDLTTMAGAETWTGASPLMGTSLFGVGATNGFGVADQLNNPTVVMGGFLSGISGLPTLGMVDNGTGNGCAIADFGGTPSVICLSALINNLVIPTCTNSSPADPVACGTANSGLASVATGVNPTQTIDTTGISTSSKISFGYDETLGSALGVTCNTTLTQMPYPIITARVNGTSFTFQVPATVTVNPLCMTWTIVN